MQSKIYLSLFLIFFLSGCFTYQYYDEPNKNNFNPTIRAYENVTKINKIDDSDLRSNVLQAITKGIDGKQINYGWLNGLDNDFSITKPVILFPGKHVINIETYIVTWKGSVTTTTKNQINLVLNAKLGVHYQLQVRLIGNNVKVWIQDEKGKIDSQILTLSRSSK